MTCHEFAEKIVNDTKGRISAINTQRKLTARPVFPPGTGAMPENDFDDKTPFVAIDIEGLFGKR